MLNQMQVSMPKESKASSAAEGHKRYTKSASGDCRPTKQKDLTAATAEAAAVTEALPREQTPADQAKIIAEEDSCGRHLGSEQAPEPADQGPSKRSTASAVNNACTAERGNSRRGVGAISARGFTLRGRVRQKSHKSAALVQVGNLR